MAQVQETPSRWQRLLTALRSSWSGPVTSSSPELARIFADTPTHSGVAVNAESALSYPPFWSAVSLISGDVAGFPLILYKRLPNGGKERYASHSLYRILHDEPNSEMSSMVFRETLQAHLLTWGNAYAEIERDRGGRVMALWPMAPNRVTPDRSATGGLVYRVNVERGTDVLLQPSQVLHLQGLGFDGIVGYSVIRKARESLGLGLAMQQFGASFFGSGTSMSGVFVVPGMFGPGQKKEQEDSLRAFHQGLGNAHRFALLEGGMDYKRLGVPPEDAQFLESRSFHISDVARWFNLSPHKLGDHSHSTFSNIEHLEIDHVVTCLRRWLLRWEQEINRKLIATPERNIQFVEHLVDARLRGDIQSRYAAYAVGRQWGWLSADDVREFENMNPLPDGSGKVYFVPQNMWPADKLDEMIKAQSTKPAPTPDTKPKSEEGEGERALSFHLKEAIARAQLAEETVAEWRTKAELAAAKAADLEKDTTALTEDVRVAKDEATTLTDQLGRLQFMEAEMKAERDILQTQLNEEREKRAEQAKLATEATVKLAYEQEARTSAEREAEAAKAEQVRLAELADAERQAKAAADAVKADALTSRDAALKLVQTKTEDTDAELEHWFTVREATEHELTEVRAALQETSDALTAQSTHVAELNAVIEPLQAQIKLLERSLSEQAETREAVLQPLRSAVATLERELAESKTKTTELEAKLSEAEATVIAAEAKANVPIERGGPVLAAHRGLFVDVARRMVLRETDRLRRAQGSPDKLRTAIRLFYDGHEELLASAIAPALRVHLAWIGADEDPVSVAKRLAHEHVESSIRDLHEAMTADPVEEFQGMLESTLTRWEARRADAFADAIVARAIDAMQTGASRA